MADAALTPGHMGKAGSDLAVALEVAVASQSEILDDVLEQVLHTNTFSFHSIEARGPAPGHIIGIRSLNHRNGCKYPRSSERWTCRQP